MGLPASDVIFASAKDGTGVDEILEAVVHRVSPPEGADEPSDARPHLRFPLPTPTKG